MSARSEGPTGGPEPSESVVDYAWRLERAWSETANRAKSALTTARTATLLLLVGGAASGGLAAQDFASGRWRAGFGIGAALALGVAGAMEAFAITPEKSREWTGARMASERLKAAVFRHLARVVPYDGDDAARSARLLEDVAEIEEVAARDAVRLPPPEGDSPPVAAPGDEAAVYLAERAEDQYRYHLDQGGTERRHGRRLRQLVFVLTVSGAILAAFGAFHGGVAAWIGTISAASAAVTTHAGAARHQEVASGYARTAARLEVAIQRFVREPDAAAALPDFVGTIEDILAVQNDLWSDVIDR